MTRLPSPAFRLALRALGAATTLLLAHSAQALPSFARQTGQDCVACHVGAFGPQLTPYGMKFKIGGYTDSNGQDRSAPLSAMVVASHSRTQKNQDTPPEGSSKTNNITQLDEASVFLAGKLTDHLGSFTQVTYDGSTKRTAIDQLDLRYARTLKLAGREVLAGVSVNNAPMTQDPFNTGSIWGFPYIKSPVAPTPGAATLVNGGLDQRVLGVSGYTFVDDRVYAELGTYRSLSLRSQRVLGLATADDPGRLGRSTLYYRIAYLRDLKSRAYSVGLFGLNARLAPDRASSAADRYRDIGVDGSYTFLGTRKHVASVYGSYVRERRTLDTTGAALAGDPTRHKLNEFKLTGSYAYNKTYGGSLSRFDTRGQANGTLYGDGFAAGSPNSAGWVYQVDWTPWGKEDSWLAPLANLRLGAQYTQYQRFNGAAQNYDGNGRNARDNNTLYLFAWTAL